MDLRSLTILGVILPETGLPAMRMSDDENWRVTNLRVKPAAFYRLGAVPGVVATGRHSSRGRQRYRIVLKMIKRRREIPNEPLKQVGEIFVA